MSEIEKKGISRFMGGAEGLQIPEYDYIARSWVAETFTETWTFKTGGAAGTTVATVTIVYDDESQTNIVTVTKT